MSGIQQKISLHLLEQLKNDGYSESLILRAYSDLGYSGDYEDLKDYMERIRKAQFKSPVSEKESQRSKTINYMKNDFAPPQDIYEMEDQVEKAIKLSKQEAGSHDRPDRLTREIIRGKFAPAAIRNRKNICFINAILQTVYRIKNFHHMILRFCSPDDVPTTLSEKNINDLVEIKRKKGCINLLQALQRLFVLMNKGKKSEVDPLELMNAMIDTQGEPVEFGEEQDINEFFIQFTDRLEEGLELSKDKNVKGEEFRKIFSGEFVENISFELNGWQCSKIQPKKTNFESILLSLEPNADMALCGCGGYDSPFMLSLASNFFSKIEGYEVSRGDTVQKVTANKETLISNLPEVLAIFLQRVVYDMNTMGLKKLNTVFEIPKEFYIDQFLKGNERKVEEIRKKEKPLKRRIEKLREKIQAVNQLSDTLSRVGGLVDSSIKKFETLISNDFEQEDDIDENISNGIKKLVSELDNKNKEIDERMFYLNDEIKKYEDEIKKLSRELRTVKYHIQSIVIHEGDATSGHYYTLVYDRKNQEFVRFNDSKVDRLSEEVGFRLARGQEGDEKNICAYCAFYVKEDCEILDFNDRCCIEELEKITSNDLHEFVEKENKRFDRELEDCQNNLVEKLRDEYLIAMNSIENQLEDLKDELDPDNNSIIPVLPPYEVFLLMDNDKFHPFVYWYVFKSVSERYDLPYKLFEGEKENFYYQELDALLLAKRAKYSPGSFELSDAGKKFLNTKKGEYLAFVKCVYALEDLLSVFYKDCEKSLAIIGVLFELLSNLKRTFYTKKWLAFSKQLFLEVLNKIHEEIKKCLSQETRDFNKVANLLQLTSVQLKASELIWGEDNIDKISYEFAKNVEKLITKRYSEDKNSQLSLKYVKKLQSNTSIPNRIDVASLISEDLALNRNTCEDIPSPQQVDRDNKKIQALYKKFVENYEDPKENRHKANSRSQSDTDQMNTSFSKKRSSHV